jgi:hypothetical protein
LPDPFWPTSATISPAATPKSTSVSACSPGKLLLKPSTDSSGAVAVVVCELLVGTASPLTQLPLQTVCRNSHNVNIFVRIGRAEAG